MFAKFTERGRTTLLSSPAQLFPAKNRHNFFLQITRRTRRGHMRKSGAILLGPIAVLAVLSAPVLAKSAGAQKAEAKSALSGCSAYEQAPDGSWKQLPCQEISSGGATHQRSAPSSSGGDDNR
ncbi:hypothetical protein KMZ68_12365 [Bradyrhizobium sediminis]|uniref:Uncharacterized protein n=1 Tax=Bradyrhizobium sediminis TaxID=2840469 RepID=A0A975NSN1_9BRAD|nr:hypothetical protein [Bradyrhizobium sediminis]QWG20557.1 hypothetical protein KMZ68_12365 [Bradyrhizobium sediminis]